MFESVARKLLKFFLKDKENELLRAREHRSGTSTGGNQQRMQGEDTFSKKLKIGDPKEKSRKSEGCC